MPSSPSTSVKLDFPSAGNSHEATQVTDPRLSNTTLEREPIAEFFVSGESEQYNDRCAVIASTDENQNSPGDT